MFSQLARPTKRTTLLLIALLMCSPSLIARTPAVAQSNDISALATLMRKHRNENNDRLAYEAAQQIIALATKHKTITKELAESHVTVSLIHLGNSNFQGSLTEARHALLLAQQLWGGAHPLNVPYMNHLAFVYAAVEQFAQAEPLYLQSMTILEGINRNVDAVKVETLNQLANLYRTAGRWKDVILTYSKLVLLQEAMHGSVSNEVSLTLNRLAQAFALLRQWKELEAISIRSLDVDKRLKGEKNQATAVSYYNLASAQWRLGKLLESRQSFDRAKEIVAFLGQTRTTLYGAISLGRAHLLVQEGAYPLAIEQFKEIIGDFQNPTSDKAASRSILGSALMGLAEAQRNQADLESALSSYSKAIAVLSDDLDQSDPAVASAKNGLGVVLTDLGRFREARELLLQALKIRLNTLGPDSDETGTTVFNLAELFRELGDYEKAEGAYQQAFSILRNALGETHTSTANALMGLAALQMTLRRLDSADSLLAQASKMIEASHAQAHPLSGAVISQISLLRVEQGRIADAESLILKALNARHNVPGRSRATMIVPMINLALIYSLSDRANESEALLREAISIIDNQFKGRHFSAFSALENLSVVLLTQGRFLEARRLAERALELQAASGDPNKQASASYQLALIMERMGDRSGAINELNAGLRILQSHRTPNLATLSAIHNSLGANYSRLGNHAQAEASFTNAINVIRVAFGDDSVLLSVQLANLGFSYLESKQYAKAENALAEALRGVERVNGLESPRLIQALIGLERLYGEQGRFTEAEQARGRIEKLPLAGTRRLTIYFATNRARTEGNGGGGFGKQIADVIRHGSVDVSALKAMVSAQADRRAKGLGLLEESSSDLSSERRFVVGRLEEAVTPIDWRQRFVNRKAGTLVFVHGFNVSFEEGLRRAAQIAFDLDFKGNVVLFSWPSNSDLLLYRSDRINAGQSSHQLARMLRDLRSEEVTGDVYVIAHSMGNVVLMGALEELANKVDSTGGSIIKQLIMAHPDIDQRELERFARAGRRLGAGITMYVSRDDRALLASRFVNRSQRAGATPLVVTGVDTIDITGLGASMFGLNHGAFAGNSVVFNDIAKLIKLGDKDPARRTKLFSRATSAGGAFWQFNGTLGVR